MTYAAAKRKLKFEQVLMFPFVALGKLAGKLFPLSSKHRVVLFFPNGDIGGSPQVNIDLTNCIKDANPLIIFSKKPKNNQFRSFYDIPNVRVIDLHKWIDNKLFHFVNFFFRGVLASWIHQQKEVSVLGGESIYFYKVIPHLKKTVKRVEICHLPTWLPYSIGLIDDIDARVFSSENLRREVIQQYAENNLPTSYNNKLHFIDNAIDIPTISPTKNMLLKIFFIGRGAPQKRVHLIAAIAEKAHQLSLPAEFNFVGDVENSINIKDYPYCTFWGNIKDQRQMKAIYSDADLLLMTSANEGLPIVVMEMMAHGKVVISTAVNAIPDYVQHQKNGILLYSTNESDIVDEAIKAIQFITNNPALLQQLGTAAHEFAKERFSREQFCREYREILGI